MTTRIERTEACYRNAMRSALIDVLKIINPQDQISFGLMDYKELVTYTRDWLNTEKTELLGEPTSVTVYPDREGGMPITVEEFAAEPSSLSLE